MPRFQSLLLIGLVACGLWLAFVPITPAPARGIVVTIGLALSCVAVMHGAWSVFRRLSLGSLAVACCSWATGWLLWPFWVNQMHRREASYRVFAQYPAEKAAPGVWMYDTWAIAALIGWWLLVALSAAYMLLFAVQSLLRRKVERADALHAGLVLAYWAGLGSSVWHALDWILD